MPARFPIRSKVGWPLEGPPSVVNGPTMGVGAIRSGAGPRTVTDPGGGIAFNNASDLNALINANPANSVFVGAGNQTYTRTSSIRDYQKNPTIIFLPGALIQGPGYSSSTTVDALAGDGPAEAWWGGAAFRGTIRGGIWENFRGGPSIGTNGVLEDIEVRWCWNTGIYLSGDNPKLRYFHSHHNGLQGVGASGWGNGDYPEHAWSPSSPAPRLNDPWRYGLEMSFGEVAYNNQAYDPVFAGSGRGNPVHDGVMKFLWRANDWVHHCWFHDNQGWAIWWDIYNRGEPTQGRGYVLCEENVSEYNGVWRNVPPQYAPIAAARTPKAIAASPTGLTQSGNTVTVTTTSAHGLAAGNLFNIRNQGHAGYYIEDGVVVSVISTTKFTYNAVNSGLPASGGGEVWFGRTAIGSGIFYEISWGPAIFRHNYSAYNSGAQFHLRSANVPTIWYGQFEGRRDTIKGEIEVYNNDFRAGPHGWDYGKSYACFLGSDEPLSELYVHDNDISSARFHNGFTVQYTCDTDWDLDGGYGIYPPEWNPDWPIDPARNIRFENNIYKIYDPNQAKPFWWGNPLNSGGVRLWGEWNALGHDETGSITWL